MSRIDSKRRVQRASRAPGLDLENEALDAGARLVAGVDEAGRGPWAGPVVAAAVILDGHDLPEGIADSKALSAQKREVVAERIRAVARVGVGIADVARIDRDNILNATHWAMAEAVRQLGVPPCLVLVDGNRLPGLPCEARAIVKGDAISASIAAASIIAKVTRDDLMTGLALEHPGYGFERHKGYGTAEHRAALERFGPCAEHRRSFRPVQLAACVGKA